MKKLLAPLAVAVVVAMVLTMAMYLYVSVAAGDMSAGGSRSLDLGPLRFVTVSREVTPEGSTASVVPGPGLSLLWVLAVGYGAAVGVRRSRANTPAGRS